jgi:hypothetical protein
MFRHRLFGFGLAVPAAACRQFRAGIAGQAQEGDAGKRRNRRDAEEGEVEIRSGSPCF